MRTADNRQEEMGRFLEHVSERSKLLAAILRDESQIVFEGGTVRVRMLADAANCIRDDWEQIETAARDCWGPLISVVLEKLKSEESDSNHEEVEESPDSASREAGSDPDVAPHEAKPPSRPPRPPEPIWDNIPAVLIGLPRWVLWRYELRDKKWTKPPYQPDGRLASTTDPNTWSRFEEVQIAYETRGFEGVGIVLDGSDELMGFDFDHCLGPDRSITNPEVEKFVPRLNSYTEISPSGAGLRVFAYAELPSDGRKKGSIECYSRRRYLTMTGNHFDGTPLTIEHRQEAVDAVQAAVFAERNRKREQTQQEQQEKRGADQERSVDDEELLTLARQANNGAKFKKLYDEGNRSDFKSESEADLSLCSMLAFWTRRDAARIDRLFRSSALMRDKWNRDDYRERTIAAAIAGCDKVWSGPIKKEAPRPLFREIVPGEPFPTEALGAYGAAAATDLHRATGAHPAICGQAILSKMNLVTMGQVNSELPHGEIKPISEYFVTIAGSGERKTAADSRAAAGIVGHQNATEQKYREEYFQYKNAYEVWKKERDEILADKSKNPGGKSRKERLKDHGPEPEPPITNIVLIGADPTLEGLMRFYREGASIAGLFTSEGAGLVGGHSMSDEARLRTVAGFSLLWDGATLLRVRGSESHSQVRDRRLAMHILIQPRIADRLYGDPDLNDQGVLTRMLAIMPDTTTDSLKYIPRGE